MSSVSDIHLHSPSLGKDLAREAALLAEQVATAAKDEGDALALSIQDLTEVVAGKADIVAVNTLLAGKASTAELQTLTSSLNGKADNASVQSVSEQIATLSGQVATKEPAISAGLITQYWRGDKTWSDLATDIRSVVITGYVVGTNAALAATDTLLGALGKIQAQINGKENAITAGTTAQYWKGNKTWGTLATDVRAVVLTGLSTATNAAVTATDSILAGFGKIQAQINALTTTVDNKADSVTVNSALATKADKATTLAGYNIGDAYTSAQVDASLLTKADKATTLSGYGIADAYTKTETDNRIQAVIGTAPVALDTLGEIAAQLQNDESAVSALTNTVSQKANTADVNAALATKADAATVSTALAGKEPAVATGTTGDFYRGDKTWVNLASTVLNVVLAGLSTATSSPVVAADSLLLGVGKLQAQINTINTSLAGKEASIAAGTTSQYWRGDKTWQTLSSAVLGTVMTGLSTATNAVVTATDTVLQAVGKLQAQITALTTTVANKADTSALATKENTIAAGTSAQYWKGDKTWGTFASDVIASVLTGLSTASSSVVAATDSILSAIGKLQAQITSLTTTVSNKADSSTVTAGLASKEPTITVGTASQYWRGDKTWVDFSTAVRSAVLTGLSTATNAAILATDTVLVALGKLQAQINNAQAYVDTAIVNERSAVTTLTNKTLVEPFIQNYTEVMFATNVTGSYTVNLANGTLQKLTLTGNVTITLPASEAGKSYTIILAYSGAFVPTFSGGGVLKWSNQVAPPAKSVAGYMDIFVFTCDGTNTLGRSGGGNF